MNESDYLCPDCKETIPADCVETECRYAVGQYGGIVLATIYCTCGFPILENIIIDNSGNIPPKEN